MDHLAISVVIPVLNEQHQIEDCLLAMRKLAPSWELIVVDGGSADSTVQLAREHGADQVIAQAGGRGHQMRAGAERAGHPVLMFLHVDGRLPDGVEEWVRQTIADPQWVAGAFRVRHVCTAGTSWLKRRLVRIADRRSRKTLYPYGDQAVFLSKEDYELAGGMPKQALMEDLEFAKQLSKRGKIRIVPAEIQVSARRFERAAVRTVLCWWTFPSLYRLGVSPSRLARWYGQGRAAAKG